MIVKPFANAGNYTTFDNAILDYIMPNCDYVVWKILCATIRKTTGWNKRRDRISLSQYMMLTGITNRTVVKEGIGRALEAGYIIRYKNRNSFDYELNRDYEISTGNVPINEEDEEGVVRETYQKQYGKRTKTGTADVHTKDKKQKKYIGDDSTEDVPSCLPEEQKFLERIAEKANVQTYDNQLQMRTLIGWRRQYGEERVLEALNYYLLKGKKFADALASMQGSLPTWRTGAQTPATKSTIDFSNVG